jgi:hypothetical protein
MCRTLSGLCRALAASATLMLAACDSASNPTAVAAQEAAIKAAEAAAAATPVSVLVRGTVVDAAGRPIVGAVIECPGEDVLCTRPFADVIAEGHEHQVGTTDAIGSFEFVATSRSDEDGFLMNANGRGYQVAWREVAWPRRTCSSDQPGCTVTVHFTLVPTESNGEE